MIFFRLWRSLRDATNGILYTFRHEQNFRFQLAIGVIVFLFTFIFDIRTHEKIVVLLLIVWVLSMELLNTAIEKFLDLLKPRLHTHVATIKDVMAAVVLISSIGAFLIGCIVFGPYVVELLFR